MRPTTVDSRTSSRMRVASTGSSRPSTGWPRSGMPASAAIAATVAGASPEITRISTPCSSRNATVSRASGRSCSARTTRPSGRSPAGGGESGRAAASCAPPTAKASTRRPPPRLLACAHLEAALEGEVLGRAQHVRAPAHRQAAPSPPGGERHALAHGLRRSRVGRGDGLERGVAARRARRVAPEQDRQLALVGVVGGDQVDHPQAVLGERAGLVDADRVGRRQRLDRVELLAQRPPPRHPQRRDRIGDPGQQDEPLRDDRDHGGDGRLDRLAEGVVLLDQRPQQQRPSGTMTAVRTRISRSSPRSNGERGWRNSRASPVSRSAYVSLPTASAT